MATYTRKFRVTIKTDQEEIIILINAANFHCAMSHAKDVIELAIGVIDTVTVTDIEDL